MNVLFGRPHSGAAMITRAPSDDERRTPGFELRTLHNGYEARLYDDTGWHCFEEAGAWFAWQSGAVITARDHG